MLLSNNSVIEYIIEFYTSESGVRSLERNLASVIRSITKRVALNEKYDKKVDKDAVEKALMMHQYFARQICRQWCCRCLTTGLTWTSVGGDILFIETSLSRVKDVCCLPET